MLGRLLREVTRTAHAALQALHHRLLAATKPAALQLVAGTLADLLRSKPELVAENALLRQQLAVLTRSVKRPRCTPADRCPGYFSHPVTFVGACVVNVPAQSLDRRRTAPAVVTPRRPARRPRRRPAPLP
jgi:hypothetical protein